MSDRKARLQAALERQPTDRLPLLGGWTLGDNLHQALAGCTPEEYWHAPQRYVIEADRRLGVDGMIALHVPREPGEYRGAIVEAGFDSYRERYNSPEDVLAYVQELPSPEEALAAFDAQAWADAFRADVVETQALMGEIIYIPTLWEVVHPRFEWYWDFGYESYLMFMQLYPEAADRLFASEVEICHRKSELLVDIYRELDLLPLTLIGTDICGSGGPLIAPRLLEAFYFPHVRRGIEPLRDAGIRTVWHSDGVIEPLVGLILDAGVSGFQGFQEEYGVDIGAIAARRTADGEPLTVFAGPSTASTMRFGSPADVRQAVDHIIDTLAGECALFILPANNILPDCPVENVIAMYGRAAERAL